MLRVLFIVFFFVCSSVNLRAQEVSYTPPSMKYNRFLTLKDFLFRYAYYPAQFVKDGREANIDITLRICKDGSVCLIDLMGFNADIFEKHLTRELIKTDKRWKPAMLNGIAIDTIVKQKILYTLYSTQDYFNDSTVVEKGGGEAINYDHNGTGKRTTNSFSKTMVNNLRDYYNPKGDKVKYGEYILWRRPGYDFFAEAEQFFTDSNYVRPLKIICWQNKKVLCLIIYLPIERKLFLWLISPF